MVSNQRTFFCRIPGSHSLRLIRNPSSDSISTVLNTIVHKFTSKTTQLYTFFSCSGCWVCFLYLNISTEIVQSFTSSRTQFVHKLYTYLHIILNTIVHKFTSKTARFIHIFHNMKYIFIQIFSTENVHSFTSSRT